VKHRVELPGIAQDLLIPNKEAFERVIDNQHPITGQRLTPRMNTTRREMVWTASTPLLYPTLPSPTRYDVCAGTNSYQLFKRGCAAATVEPLLKKSSPGSITFRSRTRRIAVFLNPGDPNSFLIHEEDSLISNSEVEL
jgi:hypothetical protein